LRGTKTKVVSVRIPEVVFREVERQAEAGGRLVSEELKTSISLLFVPEALEQVLEPVKKGELIEVLEAWRVKTTDILERTQTFLEREKHSLQVLEYQVGKEKEKETKIQEASR